MGRKCLKGVRRGMSNGLWLHNTTNVVSLRRRKFIFAALAVALIGTSASAHQTFLLPDQFVSKEGEPLNVALTSALSFPNLEHGPKQDRIAFAYAAIEGSRTEELRYVEKDTLLEISFTPVRSGFAVVGASSKPRAGDIAAEEVDAYLEEIEADEAARRAFADLPGTPQLSRSYSKHAKTFVCVESCPASRTPLFASIGQKLEFVASDAGARFYRLLLDGEPLGSHTVTVVSFAGAAMKAKTDEQGVVAIDGSMKGVIMLSAVRLALPATPGGIYHSDYATLTVDLGQ